MQAAGPAQTPAAQLGFASNSSSQPSGSVARRPFEARANARTSQTSRTSMTTALGDYTGHVLTALILLFFIFLYYSQCTL